LAVALEKTTTNGSKVWAFLRQVKQARLPWLPIIIMSVVVICAIFAPLLAPHDPGADGIDLPNKKRPPALFSGEFVTKTVAEDVPLGKGNELITLKRAQKIDPEARIGGTVDEVKKQGGTFTFPLGTDRLGRDMLSRLIYGARTSATISLVALGAGAVIGTILGLIAGYKGGWIDTVIMRITDAAMGFPTILAAMIIVTILGAGILNIVLAIMVTVWARFSRMIRGEVLNVRNRDFVMVARITGVSGPVILWRHIFPNVVNTLLIIATLLVGQTILLEASLSFLGLGLEPGAAAWGLMVAEGRDVLIDMWWLALFPGLVITAVVMAFNYFGDWLRDTLDPKLRRMG
jgi:peptide/nickel transport system permease protein